MIYDGLFLPPLFKINLVILFGFIFTKVMKMFSMWDLDQDFEPGFLQFICEERVKHLWRVFSSFRKIK